MAQKYIYSQLQYRIAQKITLYHIRNRAFLFGFSYKLLDSCFCQLEGALACVRLG